MDFGTAAVVALIILACFLLLKKGRGCCGTKKSSGEGHSHDKKDGCCQ